jgi:hypothetical protein
VDVRHWRRADDRRYVRGARVKGSRRSRRPSRGGALNGASGRGAWSAGHRPPAPSLPSISRQHAGDASEGTALRGPGARSRAARNSRRWRRRPRGYGDGRGEARSAGAVGRRGEYGGGGKPRAVSGSEAAVEYGPVVAEKARRRG